MELECKEDKENNGIVLLLWGYGYQGIGSWLNTYVRNCFGYSNTHQQ